MSPSPEPRQHASPTALRLVRIALLTGVVVFGVIAHFLVRQDGPRGTPEMAPALQWVNIAFLVVAAAVILVIQPKHARAEDPAARSVYNILAWAVAESTALFGGVHFLLVGSATPYLVGLATLVASFVLVPIRE
ncbi:MAG TPA: hypothetical protein VFQ45_00960 [Longimicrobium sp.]|nr:hypothetical protein [Longimicrobium sp.]